MPEGLKEINTEKQSDHLQATEEEVTSHRHYGGLVCVLTKVHIVPLEVLTTEIHQPLSCKENPKQDILRQFRSDPLHVESVFQVVVSINISLFS